MTYGSNTGYKLLNDHLGLPGGWFYRVPETGIEVTAGSWPQLHEFVRNHYKSNAINLPSNLDVLMLEFICKNGADCAYDEVEIPKPAGRKSLQIGDVIKFSMSLLHGLTVGGGKVDQTEANRRASICSGCRFNRKPLGCTGCNARVLKEAVRTLSQHGTTPLDDQLQSCEFCGCFIRSMVWFPIETLHKFTDATENANLPAHCWKKRPCTET
jgi:hypothetical protein